MTNPSSSSKSPAGPHAVVIGTGFGGLAAAIRLGARGYRVTVCERLKQPGGRARVFNRDGFVFDAGPTVVTAPQLLEELWQLAGRRFEEDVDLRSISPLYGICFDDGTKFKFLKDHEEMMAEIQRMAPEDVAGYERFLQVSEKIFHVGYEKLASVPFETLWSMAKVAPKMISLQSYRTVYGLVSKYIRNEKLRQVLSFHTLLVGGDPYSTSSIYCLISYLEQKWGVYFPMGGTGVLVDGMANLVEAVGGEIKYGAEVTQILLEGKKATGVQLENGEEILSDLVVCNGDAAWTYRHLIPRDKRSFWTDRRIDKTKYSMSCFLWYFGTKKQYKDVDHHTILLGPRYKGLLKDIFNRKILAEDFSLYLHRPTATDPSMAPPGCDAFYVLSPVPNLQSDVDWSTEKEKYRKAIESYLASSVLPGLAQEIVTSHVITPEYFRDSLLSYHGAAFGMQPVLSQSAYFRAHNRSEDIEGLYLVGANTHPGAGLPGVVSSAKTLDALIPIASYYSENGHGPGDKKKTDVETCWQKLEEGSKSFRAASRLLPERIKDPVAAMYAFCREADDVVDLEKNPSLGVERLLERIDNIYRGRPEDNPVDRAFCDVVFEFLIPKQIPMALIEGFKWDAEGRSYETLDALEGYAARVASAVGVMMTLLMGPRSRDIMSRACDLGLAMQLTNICRDVGEDAEAGRVYLPKKWLREAGVDIDRLLEKPTFTESLGSVVKRLLEVADVYYQRADEGISCLPRDSRLAIRAARLIYADIGNEIRQAGYDSISNRAYTSKGRKLWLLTKAGNARFWTEKPCSDPPRPAVRFLVDAVSL